MARCCRRRAASCCGATTAPCRSCPHNAGVKLPALPGGLITRPTLVWDVAAQRAGSHRTRVSYQTQGMTWWADYNVTYAEGANANSLPLDIGAWVSIINQSGAGYPDAKLKLVAGDVHRATAAGAAPGAVRQPARRCEATEKSPTASTRSRSSSTTCTRSAAPPRCPTTRPSRSSCSRRRGACRAKSCWSTTAHRARHRGFLSSPATDRNYGVQSNRKVDVYLQFKNAEANGMGMPLPAGRVRVSKLDPADQTLEFIGEDAIDHTPRNEKVLLKLGSAFDVVGERRQLDFRVDTSRKTMTEEIEVQLRNQKKERVEVMVKENLYRWVNWNISVEVARLPQGGRAHDRVSGHRGAGGRSRRALHGALHLVDLAASRSLCAFHWRPARELCTSPFGIRNGKLVRFRREMVSSSRASAKGRRSYCWQSIRASGTAVLAQERLAAVRITRCALQSSRGIGPGGSSERSRVRPDRPTGNCPSRRSVLTLTR